MENVADKILPGDEDKERQERIQALTPLAKDVALVLVKTLKATRMYLPNNPIYQRFHEELREKFDAFFEHEDYLSLRVKQFELDFMDQPVYESPDKEDNVALMFFKDGVKEFCFHKGITDEEIAGFIDILKFDIKDRELDDDLVTLMWEKDFGAITYTATDEATQDEAAEEEVLLSFDAEPEPLRQIERLESAASDAAAAGTDDGQAGGGAAHASGGFIGRISAADAAEHEEDAAAERGSYKAPDDLGLLMELTDIFYEILVTESDPERFETVSDNLAKALEIFVGRGDLALATILVMKIQELAGSERLATEPRAKLDAILGRACSDEMVGGVGKFIDEGGADFLESAGSYLRQLGEKGIVPMTGMLDWLGSRKARRALCDIISETCAGDCGPLVPFVDHPRWYVVRNVAMMLGKVGDASAVPALGKALRHGDMRVRKEALGSLAAIGGDEALGFITPCMDDPVGQIRTQAARLVSEMDPRRAAEMIMAGLGSKQFEQRDFAEKKTIYEILGKNASPEVTRFLKDRFRKKGFLPSRKKDAARALAAYGLASAGGDEARRLLDSETGSKSELLKEACVRGLRLMGGKGEGDV